MLLRLIPDNTNIRFLNKRKLAIGLSIICMLASLVICFTRGLNLGIDFTGGILIETEFTTPPDLTQMREVFSNAALGDVSLQTVGSSNQIMIRVGQAIDQNSNQAKIVETIKSLLEDKFGKDIAYRKIEFVGPKVGKELIFSGIISILISLLAIMIYIWVRFEWQYGVGAVFALIHDVILTFGFYSLTWMDFNLNSVVAILVIIGYSINDSVVIFDRIRENIRKYRKMALDQLIDQSINQNLGRTILTSLTTMISLLALVIAGGEVLRSFSAGALFGIGIGTYSSIYIAAPILIYMRLRRDHDTPPTA